MMTKPLYFKSNDYISNDKEIDDLLGKLTNEEIEELNGEIDPDNTLLPPDQRCGTQTTKEPTGPFDREALIKFITEKSKNEQDWPEKVPYEKISRGKVFDTSAKKKLDDDFKDREAKKDKEKLAELGFEMEMDDEFEKTLANATEEELVDLAAILGFTGMLNQEQYHSSFVAGEQKSEKEDGANSSGSRGGFNSITKASALTKLAPSEPDNLTDVEAAIGQLERDDADMTQLNLNNLRSGISEEQFGQLCSALHANTKLHSLHLANLSLGGDQITQHLLEMLRKNTALTLINLETNCFTGPQLIEILRAVIGASKISHIHLANQKCKLLGVRIEEQIVQAICENSRLQVVGLDLLSATYRHSMNEHLKRNVDVATRQTRHPDDDTKKSSDI